MAAKTLSFEHPAPGISPLRANLLIALFDMKTGEVFVGELVPRANDKREYYKSMVEGGVDKDEQAERGADKGERLKPAIARELLEEVGVTQATHLATAVKATACYFEDWKPIEGQKPPKYSGKIFLISAYAIEDRSVLNLSPGVDKEGDTFIRGQWMTVRQAETILCADTTSDLRRQFLHDTASLLEPVEQTVNILRQRGVAPAQWNAQVVRAALPGESRIHLTDQVPEYFPAPQKNDPVFTLPPVAELIGTSGPATRVALRL